MSSYQRNNSAQVEDENRQSGQIKPQRSRNFYRKRPGGGRKDQDLGEDENRASNDDDTQRSNYSDDNNQENDLNDFRTTRKQLNER